MAGGSGRRFGDGPLHELSLDGWNYTVALNLTSLMLSNQAAVRAFLAQGTGGTILNMGSVLGYSPSPVHFATHAYAATKSAVIGFTKSIAAYYARNDIRVNVLAPALVETPMAKRAAQDDVRLFAVYHGADFVGRWWLEHQRRAVVGMSCFTRNGCRAALRQAQGENHHHISLLECLFLLSP